MAWVYAGLTAARASPHGALDGDVAAWVPEIKFGRRSGQRHHRSNATQSGESRIASNAKLTT
jgi:hypothetical protein